MRQAFWVLAAAALFAGRAHAADNFNADVLHFTVRAGETTTLETSPVIRKKNTFLLKLFIPELSVKVLENGAAKAEKVVNLRDEHSTAWDDYQGTLKFVPK